MATASVYKQLTDLTPEDREFVEFCSGLPIDEIDVNDAVSLIRGYIQFCHDSDFEQEEHIVSGNQ